MPVLADLGPGARTLAFVGAGGAGKSTATERLAAAYAAGRRRGRRRRAARPRRRPRLAAALEPLGVSVIAADDAEQAARRLGPPRGRC